jgi:hypothetical protein
MSARRNGVLGAIVTHPRDLRPWHGAERAGLDQHLQDWPGMPTICFCAMHERLGEAAG